MTGLRASAMLVAGIIATGPLPAAAQVDDGIVLNILRECARIDDATARLACYDNNIRSAGAQARTSVPGRMDRPSGGAPAPAGSAAGFGGEDVPVPARAAERAPARGPSASESLSAQVVRVDPREPGIYVLTLADGAQWEFVRGVDAAYRLPRSGDTVRIDRAALDSYLLQFNDQMGVRIRRVR